MPEETKEKEEEGGVKERATLVKFRESRPHLAGGEKVPNRLVQSNGFFFPHSRMVQ